MFCNQKPLEGFLNSYTYEDIYFRQVQKLRILNIRFEQIARKKNAVADGLNRTIFEFDEDESIKETPIIRDLANKVTVYLLGDKQYQKTSKGSY